MQPVTWQDMLEVINSKKKARYHGSWTHLSGTGDSRGSGHIACKAEYNRASSHIQALQAHTAATLVKR